MDDDETTSIETVLHAAGLTCMCGNCCQVITEPGPCPRCGPPETWPKLSAEAMANLEQFLRSQPQTHVVRLPDDAEGKA